MHAQNPSVHDGTMFAPSAQVHFFLEKDKRIVEKCAKFKRMHNFKIRIYQIKYNARDFYL